MYRFFQFEICRRKCRSRSGKELFSGHQNSTKYIVKNLNDKKYIFWIIWSFVWKITRSISVLQKTRQFQRGIFFVLLNPQPNGACFAGMNFDGDFNLAVLDRRPKVYGRSRRFETYGYGYGGRSLRPFLRPKVLFVIFFGFFPKWRPKCVFHYTGATLD